MKRKIRTIAMAILLAGFLFGAYRIYSTNAAYAADRKVYEGAVSEYVQAIADEAAGPAHAPENGDNVPKPVCAPLQIDFDKLAEDCPDIQGWIYCAGTNINYPVVQGRDNDQYLRHTYLGDYAVAGSIFLEAANSPGFRDSNTIIYGHHMNDDSMFACLSNWADQSFYEEHPVMWLLTPEQDYMVELFSGYLTPAGSEVYVVFQGPSKWFNDYLDMALSSSDFKADPDFVPDGEAQYVLLSTCDYTYANARYVLHGKLIPVERAE